MQLSAQRALRPCRPANRRGYPDTCTRPDLACALRQGSQGEEEGEDQVEACMTASPDVMLDTLLSSTN